MVEISKSIYHMDNLEESVKRSIDMINNEDISIKYLYDCMKEKLSLDIDKYNSFIKKIFNKTESVFILSNKTRSIIVFKNETNKNIYLKDNNEDIDFIKKMPIFLIPETNKLYAPENEIDTILNKNYIYLGRFYTLVK